MKANVKCDTCGYTEEVEFDSIPEYHNKPCPECNGDILINDFDMEVFNAVKMMHQLGLAEEPEEGKLANTVVDTADGKLSVDFRGE